MSGEQDSLKLKQRVTSEKEELTVKSINGRYPFVKAESYDKQNLHHHTNFVHKTQLHVLIPKIMYKCIYESLIETYNHSITNSTLYND